MNYKEVALKELSVKSQNIGSYYAVVGLDGFIDKLMTVVKSRHGQGMNYTAFTEIAELGDRISSAAGMSTNIEMVPLMEKLGGNGPIMANAVLSGGMPTSYIGALGSPQIHPIFQEFAERTKAISLTEPGVTHALEFVDGKIMLGSMISLDNITYANIIDKIEESAFIDMLSRADLVALTNWTMIPNMTSIFNAIVDRALPSAKKQPQRVFFFDLADPEKRSDSDIKNALMAIKRFQHFGHVTLGLNLKEGRHIYRLLENETAPETTDGLKTMALRICQQLEIGTVVIHPREGAACANCVDAHYVQGSFCEKPLITTGAGDHFNAGFATAQVLGLSPSSCLIVAVAYSGFYVRTAKSPNIQEIEKFIQHSIFPF